MATGMSGDPLPPPSNRKIALGASVLAAVSVAKMILQLIAIPLMARLLGPSEFGLYALAIPVVAFVTMLSDGGLGVSLVKEPDSSPVWSTAFWALLGIGIILAGTLAGAGIVLGMALNQPRLPAIMAALSVAIPLMTATVPALARLDRQGRIAVGAGADLLANILGTSIGLLLAFRGAGAWSLVAQYVTVYAIRAAVVNAAAFKRPAFEFRPAALVSHFATGGLVLGVRSSDFAGRMLENLILGHALGTAVVGLYAFANQVPRFISEAFSNPLWLSLYIRTLREETPAVADLHRQSTRLLGMILFPLAALFIVTAPGLVPIFLGVKWMSAIPALQILLPAYVLNVIASQHGAVLMARGRYEIQLYCTIGLTIGKVLAVCLAPWVGLIGVVWGVAAVNAGYACAMLTAAPNATGSGTLTLVKGLAGPFTASLFAGSASWVFLRYYGHGPVHAAACLVLGPLAYAAAILPLDRKYLLSDLTLLRNMLGPRRTSPVS